MWNPQSLWETIQQSQSNHSPIQQGDLLVQTNASLTYLGNEEEIPFVISPDIRGVTLFSSKSEVMKLPSPLEGFNIPDSRLGQSFSQDNTVLSTLSPNNVSLLSSPHSHLIRKNVLSVGDQLPSFSAKHSVCSFQNYNIIPTQSIFPVSYTTAQGILNNYVIASKSISMSPYTYPLLSSECGRGV